MLNKKSRVLDIKRKNFILKVVDKLKKIPVPSRIKGMSLFNLIKILSSLLLNKRYNFYPSNSNLN
jgi:hypothetical protein